MGSSMTYGAQYLKVELYIVGLVLINMMYLNDTRSFQLKAALLAAPIARNLPRISNGVPVVGIVRFRVPRNKR